MATKTQVEFHFVGDISRFAPATTKARQQLEQLGATADKTSKKSVDGFSKLKAALVGAGIIAFAQKSASAFLQEQVATTKLQNTLKNNPQLAHASEKSFEDLAKSISYKTAADKESVLSGIAVLGQFKLNAQQLKEITPLVIDYARKTGTEVPEAAANIGKAFLGNTRALKTIGISFKATGNAGKDYATILGDLKSKVGGYADAEEKSRHGIDVMQHRFHELQVEIGGKLLSAFDFLVRNFKVLGPLIIAIGAAIATVKIAKFAKDLGAALSAIRSGTGTALQKALTIIGNLGPALGGVGLALAAGVGAWALWNKGQSDARALAKTYLDALQQERDGLRGVSDALLINNLQQSGALKIARDLGISGADLVGYLHGQADATDRVTAAATKQVSALYVAAAGTTVYTGKGADLISALGTQRDAYNTATQALGDVTSATKSATSATNAHAAATKTATVRILGMTKVDFKTWADGLKTSLNFVSGALSTLGGNAKLSAKDVLKAFDDELKVMANYKTNFDDLIKRHAPADLLTQLADMGEQGAPIIAALAHANKKQFDKIVSDWETAGQDARHFGDNVYAMAKRVGGYISGIPNKLITIEAKLGPELTKIIHSQSKTGPSLALRASLSGFAEGGPVSGPVGKAQLAIVHGGEYVLSRRMLDALGRGVPVGAGVARGGDGAATYDDHSTVHIYNPVPEKLSETLPALRRRKQLLRGY